jgi:hypothetical protein
MRLGLCHTVRRCRCRIYLRVRSHPRHYSEPIGLASTLTCLRAHRQSLAHRIAQQSALPVPLCCPVGSETVHRLAYAALPPSGLSQATALLRSPHGQDSNNVGLSLYMIGEATIANRHGSIIIALSCACLGGLNARPVTAHLRLQKARTSACLCSVSMSGSVLANLLSASLASDFFTQLRTNEQIG